MNARFGGGADGGVLAAVIGVTGKASGRVIAAARKLSLIAWAALLLVLTYEEDERLGGTSSPCNLSTLMRSWSSLALVRAMSASMRSARLIFSSQSLSASTNSFCTLSGIWLSLADMGVPSRFEWRTYFCPSFWISA